MRVYVSGASGLIGSRVVSLLQSRGDDVVRLVRRAETSAERGLPQAVFLPSEGVAELDGADAVIHLAGESIAGGRWTDARKQRILESRTQGTAAIARAIADMEHKPATLISASAIGYYGDRGDDWVDEHASPGDLFISDVCIQWEAAADLAREAGVRVVHPRIGIVLDRTGGALGTMLTPFKLGLGGVVGPGSQYMSWISLEDVAAALVHLLDADVSGPVNLVGPDPATNRTFTQALGRALGRPTFLPIPAFGAKAVFGEMGEELLLASTRVRSQKLVDSGFTFTHPTLSGALEAALR